MKKFFLFAVAILFSFVGGASMGMAAQMTHPELLGYGFVGLSLSVGYLKAEFNLTTFNGGLTIGLYQEAWLTDLREQFVEDDAFLMTGKNMDAFVEYDKINWAIAGGRPNVNVNPSPGTALTPSVRTDTAGQQALDWLVTDPTIVTDIETISLAFDKRASVLLGHKDALRIKSANKILYKIGAATNTTATPVIVSTGSASTFLGGGKKSLTSLDIATLASKFDDMLAPKEGRVLVMPNNVYWDLVENNAVLKAQFGYSSKQGVVTGVVIEYYGFKLLRRSDLPYYTLSTKNKIAYGATPAAGDYQACLAFVENYTWGRAMGTSKMYFQKDSPIYFGDITNFGLHFGAELIEQKYVGGIIIAP
jgi:hypothetical protein